MESIKQTIAQVCKDLFSLDVQPELTRTDEQFGDYATNVALQLAGKLGKTPREVAEAITEKLKTQFPKVEVAGPGFINISLNDVDLWKLAGQDPTESLKGQVVVAEYSDPNPFKILHAGHLYTCVVGDAIANLLETAGGKVHRVNFGGDVGLHVAKTMWAILKKLGGENPDALDKIAEVQRSDWLSSAYIEGTNAYETDEAAKQVITALNQQIYKLHTDNDHESAFAKVYWTTRDWSYQYFLSFYEHIGSEFEKFYPESETAPLGLKTVKEQLSKGVFKESEGAVVFDGEKHGLHTRVFINSQGLPTYEAKDIGLIMKKWQDYRFDKSVVITGNDIVEYMKVVLKAVEQFEPKLAETTTHITHGMVKLMGGEKMSSRKGNILRATDVLETAAVESKAAVGEDDHEAVLGAVKYAFLKQRIGADIIYDPKESVQVLGNTGPYLQYAHARARSILAKATKKSERGNDLQADERSLLRKISEYSEVVDVAVQELLPSHVCTYLYELAQVFNRFYENNRVIDDVREAVRLNLVEAYADTLKKGLSILNISAPDKM
jgi:arginyl-tRNA synthetase